MSDFAAGLITFLLPLIFVALALTLRWAGGRLRRWPGLYGAVQELIVAIFLFESAHAWMTTPRHELMAIADLAFAGFLAGSEYRRRRREKRAGRV